jgi:hypothetical protein
LPNPVLQLRASGTGAAVSAQAWEPVYTVLNLPWVESGMAEPADMHAPWTEPVDQARLRSLGTAMLHD